MKFGFSTSFPSVPMRPEDLSTASSISKKTHKRNTQCGSQLDFQKHSLATKTEETTFLLLLVGTGLNDTSE